MKHGQTKSIITILVAGMILSGATGMAAANERADGAQSRSAAANCTFFQGQAYRKGLGHFATEMLWACEAIATRRAAAKPLGDPLRATESAMHRYRSAVISAGNAQFVATRSRGPAPTRLGLTDQIKAQIAAETGALAALAAIRDGF